MDTINIKNLEIFANHGVLKEENALGQKFLVSVVLFVDTRQAGLNDDLNESVNYALVCNEIKAFVQGNTFKLIETVAEKLARHLLIKFDKVKSLKVEIRKPWAPIMQSLDYVSIEIERGWKKAYISLGSNIGDTKTYLNNGIEALNNNEGCRVTKISPFYTTKPVGEVEQDDFLNCCVEIETLYSPYELLTLVNKIEMDNNRERIIHWGPRTLDMDIVLYESCIMNEERLTIPHKEMDKREFVLRPLNDIAPYEKHPVLNKSIGELFNLVLGENINV